jgi:N4-(beta-N-acetylglucosaminyl)-L-asparaginase
MLDRRRLLVATAAASAALVARDTRAQDPALAVEEGDRHRGPCSIASGNGLRCAELALARMTDGMDPLDAAVAGVTILEDDPEDQSVGLGGLPNEDGVVQLDASCMHGPTHRAGAVGALERIQNPAQVALLVLKRTDHVMLVGEGARRFALAHGFEERNLLTEKSRKAWLAWKSRLSPEDDWLDPDQQLDTAGQIEIPYTSGTVHCSAVNAAGDLGATTSTSGLSYKIPGRLGDSPIVGAGMYCDNAVGSAGATGRGEAVMQVCGAFSVVRAMEDGMTPTEACLHVLRRIVERTRRPYLLAADGRPDFNVTLYALRKDGAFGSACLRPGGTFAVATPGRALVLPSRVLLE